jgi:hypothetical protein
MEVRVLYQGVVTAFCLVIWKTLPKSQLSTPQIQALGLTVHGTTSTFHVIWRSRWQKKYVWCTGSRRGGTSRGLCEGLCLEILRKVTQYLCMGGYPEYFTHCVMLLALHKLPKMLHENSWFYTFLRTYGYYTKNSTVFINEVPYLIHLT